MTISQFTVIVIFTLTGTLSFAMIYNYSNLYLIYGQTNNTNDTNTNIDKLDNISSSKHVKVGDIDISYTIFGKGDLILLINGYSLSKNGWDPTFLKELSANHTVIIFDNRGVGNTTAGSKNFTIEQFAADSAGLLDALDIPKFDVLGFSMGGMIAQQLTLNFPDKVDDLIIYASSCGGNQSIPPSKQIQQQITELTGSAEDIKKRFIPLLFNPNWIEQNPDYMKKFASFELPPIGILQKQGEAIFSWKGTCDQLRDISRDTLMVTGTDDILLPSANSIILTENIPGAWLAQFKEGGHGVMYQYPEKLSAIVNTFLDN